VRKVSLIPLANAPTAKAAEDALARLRDVELFGLQAVRPNDQPWQLAVHGLADGVEDVIVTIRRLATHERVWRESKGTKPVEPPFSDDPNQNAMQQMVRGRSDLRAFLLLTDVLLDDTAKALRALGATTKATESFLALSRHLESGGAEWSAPLLPLTKEVVGLQYSLGYFRDKFVAHRGIVPVGAVYLPDGKMRLAMVGGTKSLEDRERAGREAAELMPVPGDPLDEVYDVRLDIAFLGLRHADPDRRDRLGALLQEFGAVSPDPYEISAEVASTVAHLLTKAAKTGSDASAPG
jgi:hypothetical protein